MNPVRVARPGDICVLLVPPADELPRLRQHQAELQAHFGGEFHKEIHLTCQRFELPPAIPLEELKRQVRQVAASFPPFPIIATELAQQYAPFWQTRLLRWHVRVTGALIHFVTELERMLLSLGITPHYTSIIWQEAAHVTALEGVTDTDPAAFQHSMPFPYHLFTAHEALLSRIQGRDDFEILDRAPLAAQ